MLLIVLDEGSREQGILTLCCLDLSHYLLALLCLAIPNSCPGRLFFVALARCLGHPVGYGWARMALALDMVCVMRHVRVGLARMEVLGMG